MILKSITPRHFGPFAADSVLYLDRDVTVLTGPNDVGKSLALRAIQILCTDAGASAHEIHRDRIGEFDGRWEDDSDVCCEADFELTEQTIAGGGLPKDWKPGATIHVRKRMTVRSRVAQVTEMRNGGQKQNPKFDLDRFPSVLVLPLESEIRETIDLGTMSEAETNFVRLGFGSKFSLEQHRALSEINRSFRIDEAVEKLNSRLKVIVPRTMNLRFKLLEVAGKPEVLGVGLVDEHSGYAPLGSRGAGVRRLLNVMGALLRLDPRTGHSIILYDEPETSLHSDAQHMLRRLLESLAAHPSTQVIYATHSPAMINTLRPNSVRVLERRRQSEKAVSCFVSDAFSGNYSLVRSSLGISPADSLLYSPITVVVEGPTEVRALPLILLKLAEAGIVDRSLLDVLLPQIHLLDGEGAKFEYMCRLAKSQRAQPVLFLDGDKSGELQKIREKHAEVPIILLPPGTEFEEVVPRSKYIDAAAELLDDNSGRICEAAFSAWEAGRKPRPTMMYSKRVERWLEDEFGRCLSKPRLMEKAIEITSPSEIVAAPFSELVMAMSTISRATEERLLP